MKQKKLHTKSRVNASKDWQWGELHKFEILFPSLLTQHGECEK